MTTNTDLADALREIADTLPLGSALIVRLAADRLTTVADGEVLGEHDPDRDPWGPIGDGWITHGGKGRPDLPDDTITETKHRGGEEYTGDAAWTVEKWIDGPGFWVHNGSYSDIIAYRIPK